MRDNNKKYVKNRTKYVARESVHCITYMQCNSLILDIGCPDIVAREI